MAKNFLVLRYVLVFCAIFPFRTNATVGFMNDFFNRFPNLPFANMKSLEHIKNQGSMPERDSLLSDEPQPFKRQIQRSDRLLFKSKVLSAPKSDIQTTVLGTKENILTTSKYTADYKSTTQKPIPRSTRKRIFYSKPTAKSIRLTSPKPYARNSYYFNSFAIVATTPRSIHFPSSKSHKPILSTTTSPYQYSTPKTKAQNSESKFKELKKSFYFYADKYGSQHFVFPKDDELFDTQISRPRLTSDKGFYAYDPFRQSSVTKEPEEPVTLKNHFYYEDTHKMRGYHHHTKKKNKSKKGIVIKEKAVSGEVQNPIEQTKQNENMATTTEVTTTTTATITKTTTTATLLTTLETTPFTTSSTTTLSPSSISALPKLVLPRVPVRNIYRPETLKIDYNLPKEKNIHSHVHLPDRFSNGIVYSPFQYTPYNFQNFMSVAQNIPPPVPTYKYSYTPSTSIESYPKSSKILKTSTRPTFRTYTAYTPRYRLPKKQVTQEVVMPPYTPAPKPSSKGTTTVESTSPQPQYDNEEFVYYNDGGESKTFESLRTEPPQQKSAIVSQSELSAGINDLDIQENNSSSHNVHKQKKYAYRVIKNPNLPAYHSDVSAYPPHSQEYTQHPLDHPGNYLQIFKDPLAALNLSPEAFEKDIIYGIGKPGDKTYSFSVYPKEPGQDVLYGKAPTRQYSSYPPRPPPQGYTPYYPHPGVPPKYPGYSVLPPPPVYPAVPSIETNHPSSPEYKYHSKIIFKSKSGQERSEKHLFSKLEKEEKKEEKKYLPQDKIIKATFFEDDPNVEILTTPGSNIKYIKKRVRVDPSDIHLDDNKLDNNIIPESEKLTSKPEETKVVDFLELENTLEKPTMEPEFIETTVNDIEDLDKNPQDEDIQITPRPKRKIPNISEKNSFVYFKPTDKEDDNFLQHYVPQKTRFKPTVRHNATKQVTVEAEMQSYGPDTGNQALFLPDMKEEMTVSERLKQFMKKAVFKPPAFLSGFSPMSEDLKPMPVQGFQQSITTSNTKENNQNNSPKSNLVASNKDLEQIPAAGPTTRTTSPPTQTITQTPQIAKHIQNTNLVKDQNLQYKNGEDEAKLKLDNPEDLVQLIIQRYKKNNDHKKKFIDSKKKFNEVIEKKTKFTPLRPDNRRVYQNIKRLPPKPKPPQSLKDKLFGNLFRKLRKDNVDLNGGPITIHQQTQQAQRRLPQNFLHKFSRLGMRGTPPPSSQDTYRKFLKKIETKPSSVPGRFVESSIEKPNS